MILLGLNNFLSFSHLLSRYWYFKYRTNRKDYKYTRCVGRGVWHDIFFFLALIFPPLIFLFFPEVRTFIFVLVVYVRTSSITFNVCTRVNATLGAHHFHAILLRFTPCDSLWNPQKIASTPSCIILTYFTFLPPIPHLHAKGIHILRELIFKISSIIHPSTLKKQW